MLTHPLQLTEPPSLLTHPVAVYLSQLRKSSAASVLRNLNIMAKILSDGCCDAYTLDWAALRYANVMALRSILMERYRPGTVNFMMGSLRRVLQEAKRLGLMTPHDLAMATDFRCLRTTHSTRGRFLTHAEQKNLFSVILSDCSPKGCRDGALLAILLGTGIRRAEVVQLDLKDFDRDTGEIIILQGKGGQQRIVYLPPWGISWVERWLKVRKLSKGPLLYPVNKGENIVHRRMSAQAVLYILSGRAQEAGIKSVSPHDFRRTFISDLLDAGVDLLTVQNLAGHSSPETTAKYDKRGESAKRKAVLKLESPLDF